MALSSFVVSAGVVVGTFYLYKNKDAMIEDMRKNAIEEVQKALPKLIEPLMPNVPEMPKMTGPAVPSGYSMPQTTGPAIPF